MDKEQLIKNLKELLRLYEKLDPSPLTPEERAGLVNEFYKGDAKKFNVSEEEAQIYLESYLDEYEEGAKDAKIKFELLVNAVKRIIGNLDLD